MATSSHPWITSHFGHLLKFEIASKESNVSLQCHIARFDGGDMTQWDRTIGPSGEPSSDFQISESETQLQVDKTIYLAIKNCRSARLICSQKCRDSDSGITRPYVLIQTRIGQADSPYRCLLVGVFEFGHGLSTLYLHIQGVFVVDNTDLRTFDHRNIRIIDGPCLIWVDNNRKHLSYICLESETGSFEKVIRTDLKDINEDKYLTRSDYNLLDWSVVNRPNCNCKQILVLGKLKKVFQNVANKTADDSSQVIGTSVLQFFAIVYEQTGEAYRHYNVRREDVCRIIPHGYSSVITSIVMKNVEITVDTQNELGNELATLGYCGSHIFACTSQRHLLEFVDGHLVKCVDIESGSISRMLVIHGHQLQPHLCLWSSDDHSFIGVRCADLQVEMVKKGVCELIVEDFLGNGTDQLMLLLTTPTTWPPSQWNLTDLGPNYVEGIRQCASSPCATQDVVSSVQAAVKALQMRVQSDIIKLGELTCDSYNRQRLIDLGCEAVNRLTLNQEPTIPEQPDLVPLLGLPENLSSSHVTIPECPVGEKWLEVKDKWQRSCDERWVIGVEVCNVSDKAVTQLTLSACIPSHVGLEKENQLTRSVWSVKTDLSPSQSGTSSDHEDWIYKPVASKLPRLEVSSKGKQDIHKLKPGETTTVMCVISQPLFGVSVTDRLLLFLTFSTSCGQLGNKHDEKHRFTVFCGKVEFSKEDLFDPQNAIDLRSPSKGKEQGVELCRSLQSLDAAQPDVTLCLMSTQPGMTSVATALTRAGLTHQPLYDCYLCPQTLDHFRWVRLQLTTTTTGQPALNIRFRNKSQLWSVLHYLYHILPDDIAMIPDTQSEAAITRHLHRLHQMMRQEVEFTMSKLSELLGNCVKDDDIMEVELDEAAQGQSSDTLQVVRGNFSHMQKNVQRLRKDGVISQKHFREFLSDIQEYIQFTDCAMLQLYQAIPTIFDTP